MPRRGCSSNFNHNFRIFMVGPKNGRISQICWWKLAQEDAGKGGGQSKPEPQEGPFRQILSIHIHKPILYSMKMQYCVIPGCLSNWSPILMTGNLMLYNLM